MSKFASQVDVAKEIMGRGWNDLTPKQVADEHLDDDRRQVCLLARISQQLDSLTGYLDALADYRLHILYNEYSTVLNDRFRAEIKWREEAHGECPQDLRLGLAALFFSKYERYTRFRYYVHSAYRKAYSWDYPLVLPRTGTNFRQQYNRWMKRKTKKSLS